MLQQETVSKIKNQPTREYLMENLIPSLTSGLLETIKVNPEDEFEYLVRWCVTIG